MHTLKLIFLIQNHIIYAMNNSLNYKVVMSYNTSLSNCINWLSTCLQKILRKSTSLSKYL
jgi:hypothetical protein